MTYLLAPSGDSEAVTRVTMVDPRLSFGAAHPHLPQRRLTLADALFIKGLQDRMSAPK
jgi:hypothetical protein